ncbi:AIPR family protein [Mediterraneibacter catenae]|uniref:AIPR family protein n=1 Tax=Mediterraneibacter catenae TaxID=2594882 RepID=A0A5M9I1H4_9FIRM|nr:AIPR family protein [Mediterraneibacter catenae]KAA8501559.1 AIPR family protein [Mediterraneibacter catenae]
MPSNINILRISTRFHELFEEFIDMRDFPNDQQSHFETRALAATVLMIKCGLDPSGASSYITDGYRDMGIDAIYLDDNQKKLFVVQSKWRNSGNGAITQEEVYSFVEGIKRILEFDLNGANTKIQSRKDDIETAITKIGYQIQAIYVHTGNENADAYTLRPINELMSRTNDEVSTILGFEELTYKEIYTFLAQGSNAENIILDDVVLHNWGKIEDPYVAYYGIISASALGEWYNEYGNALFEKNIRFYKGRTDVNEGIKKVLLQNPENFVYYNNGIKMLCKSIKRKALTSTNNITGIFTLEGVSLVNGAQTTGSICEAYNERQEQVEKAYVMIQLIDLTGVSEETTLQITKLSNTQNRIENKDFVALDPVQEKIRQELSFSHFTYLYKGGDEINDMRKQITSDEAIIALACLWEDLSYSTMAKRNAGALSEDINKTPYKALINPSTNSFHLINSVLILRATEEYLQSKKTGLSGKEYLVCTHGNRFIEHWILQELKNKEGFSERVIGDFEEDVRNIVDTMVPLIIQQINTYYSESYPANIFKNVTKCKEIERHLLSGND